jgi:hypothetical protein
MFAHVQNYAVDERLVQFLSSASGFTEFSLKMRSCEKQQRLNATLISDLSCPVLCWAKPECKISSRYLSTFYLHFCFRCKSHNAVTVP